MNRPLLAKLTRPEPALALPRPRLLEGLDEELSLVWVSGPAGAGKTTLVSSYVVNKKNPCLWYQIDAGDADLATFFHYLGLAVQQTTPRHRKALPNLTPEYLPGLLTFTQRFFEQLYLRLSPPAVLVFDNYQEVPAESQLHEVLRTACEALPSGVRIIVLSRTKPPAPLARLRAYREMKCLDWEELRLTRDEVVAMIKLRNPRVLAELQPARIEQLHQHAQGWAAGLVLFARAGSDCETKHLAAKYGHPRSAVRLLRRRGVRPGVPRGANRPTQDCPHAPDDRAHGGAVDR